MKAQVARGKLAAKRRAPNLTPELVSEIVAIIHSSAGRLTWPLLISKIEEAKFITYTRQALAKQRLIAEAYDAHKSKALAGDTKPKRRSGSPELQIVLDELDAIRAERDRLKSENERLVSQFVRWAYNASQRGLTEEFLNQQLPERRRKRELERVK